VTADRPVELRGVGANQSIDQSNLYGGSVRRVIELSVDTYPSAADQQGAVAVALDAAATGPVHLNLSFRAPLVPVPPPTPLPPSAADTPEPGGVSRAVSQRSGDPLAAGPRTVVVAGDQAGHGVRALAEAAGWPLLAEPSSGARGGPNAMATYRLLLDHLADDVARVVVAGRPTLSRAVTGLLAREDVEVLRLGNDPRTPAVTGSLDDGWLRTWQDGDRLARRALESVVADNVSGLSVARTVAAALPPRALLVAGSSSAVRDLDLADPWDEQPLVLSNRGASGIDGTVSTAVGAALVHDGPAYALMGDLTFLHDSTGLVIGPDEPRPDLVIVVVNDDGGGLFTLLEQGAPEHAGSFERLFGTPHGADLGLLCAATGTAYARVNSLADLRAELCAPSGLRVVEVRTDRARTRDLHARLRAAVAEALS